MTSSIALLIEISESVRASPPVIPMLMKSLCKTADVIDAAAHAPANKACLAESSIFILPCLSYCRAIAEVIALLFIFVEHYQAVKYFHNIKNGYHFIF